MFYFIYLLTGSGLAPKYITDSSQVWFIFELEKFAIAGFTAAQLEGHKNTISMYSWQEFRARM